MTCLHISSSLLNHLRNRTAAARSEEICGFLIGSSDGEEVVVSRIVESPNIASHPGQNFEIDPAIHFGIRRRLRRSEDEIVGVYHSHPNGPPTPSEKDLERAPPSEEWVWLILSPAGGGKVSAQAFRYGSPVDRDKKLAWRDVAIRFTDA